MRSTSVARACPKRSPAWLSLASHTSSVVAADSSSRPPTWRSSVLRWRTMRSSSSRAASYLTASATSVSSRKRRRSAGAPLTSVRSSGENTVTRTTPSRSRARDKRWRLTCTRLRPAGTSSASISDDRPSSSRTSARSDGGRRARPAPARPAARRGSWPAWPGRRAPRRSSSCPARCRRRRRSCRRSAGTTPPRSCGSRRSSRRSTITIAPPGPRFRAPAPASAGTGSRRGRRRG